MKWRFSRPVLSAAGKTRRQPVRSPHTGGSPMVLDRIWRHGRKRRDDPAASGVSNHSGARKSRNGSAFCLRSLRRGPRPIWSASSEGRARA